SRAEIENASAPSRFGKSWATSPPSSVDGWAVDAAAPSAPVNDRRSAQVLNRVIMREHPGVEPWHPFQATVIGQHPLHVVADTGAFQVVNGQQAGHRQLARRVNHRSRDVAV